MAGCPFRAPEMGEEAVRKPLLLSYSKRSFT